MEYHVLKLGGSVISPKGEFVDKKLVFEYVTQFKSYFTKNNDKKSRVILVIGGGNTSRYYRDAADYCNEDSDVDRHRVGITATWLNAELVRSLLSDFAYERVLGVGVYADDRYDGEDKVARYFQEWLEGDWPLLVSGGFINGSSTDFNAVLLASKLGIQKVYKLSNIDYVYTQDPKENPSADPIKDMSWKEYLRQFSDDSLDRLEHSPGKNIPLDVFAAKLADENKISCRLADGRDVEALEKVLNQRDIEGTNLHP
jgi:uridylate kinase